VLPRLALVATSTALGLLLGEIALRVLGFEDELARRNTVYDARYGTVRRDSWIFRFEIPRGATEVDLRGRRVPVRKERGEVRVLFIGDSGTEGVLLPLEDTYPLVFERMLDQERPDHRVRAINAGVFGMTTIDEMHFLSSKLLPLHPDVVVVGLFMANDINFNLGHAERERSTAPRTSWARSIVQHSALAHFAYVQAIAFNARTRWIEPDDLGERSVVAREVGLVDRYGFHMLSYPMGEVATYMKAPSPLVEHAFDVLEDVLVKLDEMGKRHGFVARVLLVPAPSAVAGRLLLLHYPDIWGDLRRAGIRVRPSQIDTHAPTERVLAICARRHLVCIDPTERMRAVGVGEVFFPTDEHPTRRGHALLARELVESYERLLPDGRAR